MAWFAAVNMGGLQLNVEFDSVSKLMFAFHRC